MPISPGIAVAPAFVVNQVFARREIHYLESTKLTDEIRRFEEACASAAAEIEAIAVRVREEVGESEAAIFQAHRLILEDPTLKAKVQSGIILRRVDASTALYDVLDEHAKLFAQIQDTHLKERLSDLRDVLGRVLIHLNRFEEETHEDSSKAVIIVAHEILPSQAMMLNRMNVAGILTETGGPSGHAAILSRALGIPAVSGLVGIMDDVSTNDLIAVDGREGHVYVHPGPEVESAYRKLQREYVDTRDRLIENRDQDPISADGTRVELLANVNNPHDADSASKAGACGVGLYRTEFLFLAHPSVPDEEEQLGVYLGVIEASPNRSVTIRTLDLGGDKHVPYLGEVRETNPFMGWRSIRMTLTHPELFQTQLRAILRAGLYGDIQLLFPMVSTFEEVLHLKSMVREAEDTMTKRGIPFKRGIPIGIMVEVPASALTIGSLLPEIDFVSVGSNDLIQYVMAADRDNPKVAHLCEPFNPAILKILHHIIKTCNEHNKPVSVCGEMAGRPRCFLPLFGMGLRRFSMSPAFVPTVKELLLSTDLDTAQDIARTVLRMHRVDAIKSYLTEVTQKICLPAAQFDLKD
ncbi:MAG: phosphoenolpyruvate--protein phosphotransferase [Gemmataceae bacterium]